MNTERDKFPEMFDDCYLFHEKPKTDRAKEILAGLNAEGKKTKEVSIEELAKAEGLLFPTTRFQYNQLAMEGCRSIVNTASLSEIVKHRLGEQ